MVLHNQFTEMKELSFGSCGKFVLIKEPMVKKVTINYGIEELYSEDGLPRHIPTGLVDVDVGIVAEANNLQMFEDQFNANWGRRIRDKRVEDCTIEELLYAVRQKIK